MTNRIILNETSYFGWGAREVLVDEIKRRKFKRALVVTDETLLKVGVTNKVLSLLDENMIPYEMFSDIKPNPTISNVKKGLKIAKKYHCDYLIAVGGGSVIDTAKAIGIVINNPEFKEIKNLVGTANTKNPSLPIIALPTTAGTAAEVTINYVITDEEAVVKLVCVDPNDIPVLSIIDTELMSAMPASTAAATGLDALTHAMECYITKGAWEMSDMFALKAMKLIYENLESAVNKNRDAMDKMALAQYIAGMGFSNVGLGIVHSMAHQLGAVYDTPHGVANALLLPYILEYNGEVCPDRFRDMGRAFGLDMNGLSDKEAVKKVADAVRELAVRLNIPQHIRDIGGKEEDIPLLAKKALEDPCTGGNPREMDLVEFEKLFKIAF
ncbi:MAG TPA: lactaldehyde reductase [Candidatus Coprovivens excrementavium]|nr:lactaldehyde reductase [Candidatus Coprovivens excrementavium]